MSKEIVAVIHAEGTSRFSIITNRRASIATDVSRKIASCFGSLMLLRRSLRRSVPLAWLAAMTTVVYPSAHAQSTYVPPTIATPIVDLIDENHVSILTGKTSFSIKALELGGLSFAPYSWGAYFQLGGIIDNNYGAVNLCSGYSQNPGGYVICSTASGGVQATYGEERGNFSFSGTAYYPDSSDGSTFVDNGSTCTWTQKDGTQIIYAAYHTPATTPLCQSNNISSIVHPDGRIDTYYYYGAFVQGAYTWSPILSITTNTGYMLKYIYTGTPTFGSETNVIGINLAFQSCSPTALSCTLTSSWPTATLSWAINPVSPCDNFPSLGETYNPCDHYTFTIQDAALRNHVFQLDSYDRVVSYQPPEATSPVFNYTLCSLLNQEAGQTGQPMSNCFGVTSYVSCPGGGLGSCAFTDAPYLWDLVSTVTRNAATWTYLPGFGYAGSPQAAATWGHSVTSPLGATMSANGNGNATSYAYTGIGPTNEVELYDGTIYKYEASTRNVLATATSPLGVVKTYTFDATRSNLTQIQTTPISGSGTTQTPTLKAVYPEVGAYPCVNIITCNRPTAVIDANGNETDYTYDPTHGGMLTQMDPAVLVNGTGSLIRPQITQTYVTQSAWYFNTAGTMAGDPNPVSLLSTQSICMTSATTTAGACAAGATDQVVTTYSYGPASGPNNLLLRGKAIASNGKTLQTCYGHDSQGNKIWETSPNANPASCPSY